MLEIINRCERARESMTRDIDRVRERERERVYWKSEKINKKKIVEKILSLSGLGGPRSAVALVLVDGEENIIH